MKSYTDLEQSRKLAEILPIETADMHWQYIEEDNGQLQWFCFPKDFSINQHNTVSAWSLAALFDTLPDDLGLLRSFGDGLYYCVSGQDDTSDYNNPVDACFEMIIKLNEQKLL